MAVVSGIRETRATPPPTTRFLFDPLSSRQEIAPRRRPCAQHQQQHHAPSERIYRDGSPVEAHAGQPFIGATDTTGFSFSEVNRLSVAWQRRHGRCGAGDVHLDYGRVSSHQCEYDAHLYLFSSSV